MTARGANVVEDLILLPRDPIARELRAGQTLRITDLEGRQVGDLIAFARDALDEQVWISNTIWLNGTVYMVGYLVDDRRGCVEDFLSVLEPYGIDGGHIPMSLNVFMNCPVQSDGHWGVTTRKSMPGDHIDFRAEIDLVVALPNCPQDLNPCNTGKLKPLWVTASGGWSAGRPAFLRPSDRQEGPPDSLGDPAHVEEEVRRANLATDAVAAALCLVEQYLHPSLPPGWPPHRVPGVGLPLLEPDLRHPLLGEPAPDECRLEITSVAQEATWTDVLDTLPSPVLSRSTPPSGLTFPFGDWSIVYRRPSSVKSGVQEFAVR